MQTNPKDISIQQFDYTLPEEQIAKYPLPQRDESKLLVYKNRIEESTYKSIAAYLPQNSLLVFNNTKVIQARLAFTKNTGALIEVFCLEPYKKEISQAMVAEKKVQWKCLLGNGKKWKSEFLEQQKNNTLLRAELIEKSDDVIVEFSWNTNQTFAEILDYFGFMPLPPYLQRKSEKIDVTRYQTIYAKVEGSVAAPTAGLHFTNTVFASLNENNMATTEVTLHVGAGTFMPVKADKIGLHSMHQEFFEVELPTLQQLANHQHAIIPVGTTSLRTLETLFWLGQYPEKYFENNLFFLPQWCWLETEIKFHTVENAMLNLLNFAQQKCLQKIKGNTQIIITPLYQIKVAEAIVTNFHQPKSTLLLLVSAFVGEQWKNIYQHALENNYRFLSYGDGCILFNQSPK